MKIALLPLMLLLYPVAGGAQNIVPPEIVRFKNVLVRGDVKLMTVGNAKRDYALFCNIKASGCVTPEPNKTYLLFNKNTRWKMPGATDFITLAFVQDWTVTYNEAENIGLVAEKGGGPDAFGVFLLDKTGGGYERDTIVSDGPIIYGTGLSNEDRAKAWKHFFGSSANRVGNFRDSECDSCI
jgi:hypothetical protein